MLCKVYDCDYGLDFAALTLISKERGQHSVGKLHDAVQDALHKLNRRIDGEQASMQAWKDTPHPSRSLTGSPTGSLTGSPTGSLDGETGMFQVLEQQSRGQS